jgi:NAD+ synthase
MALSADVLRVDPSTTISSITESIRTAVHQVLHRRGAVIGLSGGIDSSLCAALCAGALGKENILTLFMPERDSASESIRLGRLLAETLGVNSITEDIAPILEAAGCYQRQFEAIRTIFPEYDVSWKNKIVLPSILAGDRLNVPRLVVQSPKGELQAARIPVGAYLKLIAATNFKQRTRKMLEYYYADRMNYAVCGTPNRLEYDQGFFVKGGDGLADFKPIAHLYKTQVYSLARAIGVPEEICSRPPTTDTFSLPQSQEEFYFALPYDKLDLCLYAHNNNVPEEETANAVGLTAEQVKRVYNDIDTKRRTTLPLHLAPILAGAVEETARLRTMADHPGVIF